MAMPVPRALLAALVLAPGLAAGCPSSADPWLDLAVAIRTGDDAAFDCNLGQVDVNGHDPSDLWENTPLHVAAKFDQAAFARRLVRDGADVDRPNAADATPLRVAIKSDASDTAAVLVFSGADIEAPDAQGRTMLFWAIAAGNVPLTRLLLERGADRTRMLDLLNGQRTIEAFALEQEDPKLRSLFED